MDYFIDHWHDEGDELIGDTMFEMYDWLLKAYHSGLKVQPFKEEDEGRQAMMRAQGLGGLEGENSSGATSSELGATDAELEEENDDGDDDDEEITAEGQDGEGEVTTPLLAKQGQGIAGITNTAVGEIF